MDIQHKHGESKGIFLARDGEETLGEMTYRMESPQVMAIDHTEVKSAERGNSIGMDLLDFAVDYARQNNVRIRPLCKFVNVMFRKHGDKYDDVNLK